MTYKSKAKEVVGMVFKQGPIRKALGPAASDTLRLQAKTPSHWRVQKRGTWFFSFGISR
jgi:hypothetical protein